MVSRITLLLGSFFPELEIQLIDTESNKCSHSQ